MECDSDVEKLSSFLVKLKHLEKTSCSSKDQRYITENRHNIKNSLIPKEKETEREDILKCLQQNEHCYSLLNSIESCLNLFLEECVKQQRILKSEIDTLLENKLKDTSGRKTSVIRKICMPYFKDADSFSHPPNEDVSKRQIQGFINQCDILVPRPWNKNEKKIVADYIKNIEEEKWTQTLASCGMLHMKNVQQMSLAELIEMRYDEYDWLKISVSVLKNTHSPHECRALWFNCLHPQINQENWTQEEQEKLRTLVEKYKFQDWERIALELGTRRVGFQCICQFQSQLNKKECKWNENEVKLLQKYVNMFSFRNFIPWRKLKRYIDGRDLNDIFKTWSNLNNIGKGGTFSLKEDIILVAGMRYFGSDYSHIKEYIPNRSARQVRKRIEVLKRRQFPMKAWSAKEDALLRRLVNKYGFGNWMKMSVHFKNRSPSAIRCRYLTLQKYESNESCASLTLRNPVRSTDPVNIVALWESAVEICQDNKIEYELINSKTLPSNTVHKIGKILKSETRHSRKVEKQKLKTVSDKQYFKFFQGAYLPEENWYNKKYHHDVQNTKIDSLVYDILMILKLMDIEINLSVIEKIAEDQTISELDKNLVKYLLHKITPKNRKISEKISSSDRCKFDLISNGKSSIPYECLPMFPPNFSTLIAVRSIFLNEENLREQGHDLTVQVDNIELKEMNSVCCPKSLHYEESYVSASKLWNERLHKILGGAFMLLNSETITSNLSNSG